MADISAELLAILACPACKKSVSARGGEICCDACHLAYPVRSGIPVMLVTEARPLPH